MEEIWKDIPNLSSLGNPNNTFDGVKLQESAFLNPNYNLNPVLLPASNNVVLLTPQPNSFSSSSCHQPMTLELCMQSSGSSARRKRFSISRENDDQNNISSSSPTHRCNQRLIKNRESAARSRDRKQAYTAQLVQQLQTLKAENAKLKMKQQLHEAAQALKKHTLKRSASCPF
ncbi:hypothetical protein DCAR_0313119 [Daucus carota subsp. sativus]|uniref:BZIP domain-containing protein n=1 Tax=Daucus carota subsp. sativus TaxID=79200 RepID=A0AAF0WPP2_DAUCS|nr:PREDICTED: bZIP transcription factor 27-like [Daucus carota subsp. sativus]WOG93832.1 hypothetical protein DCAR_0313119 [Daucus carota subsp. sativus]